MPTPLLPEQLAREKIDELLQLAGWVIQDVAEMNLHAADGVAVRELHTGAGPADYVLFLHGKAAGIIEAKKEGTTLAAVESQTMAYAANPREHWQTPVVPLPFLYESTGARTFFTNGLEPEPRSRSVFAFHRPEVLWQWLDAEVARRTGRLNAPPAPTLKGRMRLAPPLNTAPLWPPQITAITKLEQSVKAGRRKALIQMATGSGKTFTAVTALYRLIRHGGARRALFLVDRGNLGRQAYNAFKGFQPPDDGRKFADLYPTCWLEHNTLDPVNHVVISTIQRLYSILKGEEERDELRDEGSAFFGKNTPNKQMPVEFTPAVPPDFFDVIVVDECHRSIYSLWSQVLDYFDATLIGLTATPSKATYGYFDGNVVSEYRHEHAVRDKVNVPYEVWEIRTEKTLKGGTTTVTDDGLVKVRNRRTRTERWEEADEELDYEGKQLDRDVIAPDQIRTILTEVHRVIREKLYPGRAMLPKTLIFAKDDSHADDVLRAARDIFGLSNDDAVKVTYKGEHDKDGNVIAGSKASDGLIKRFRADSHPRLAVTVDMIATGTDIKPLEVVVFMRSVGSRLLFEQMVGRGVRVISSDQFQKVSGDGLAKTHFVVIDCVGVTRRQKTDPPVIRQPSLSLKQLLKQVTEGDRTEETLSTLGGRLQRMDRQLDEGQQAEVTHAARGRLLTDLWGDLLRAVDPEAVEATARERLGLPDGAEVSEDALENVQRALAEAAAAPIATNPELRETLINIRVKDDQYFDLGKDTVLITGGRREAQPDYDPHKELVSDFQAWVADNRDELDALRILYSRPHGQRLTRAQIRELAEALARPPRQWTADKLWAAYEKVEADRVKGRGALQTWTDIVSLARHALHPDEDLVPFAEGVQQRFAGWLRQLEQAGRAFTTEQRRWLEAIAGRVAIDAEVSVDDLKTVPDFQRLGGLGAAIDVFDAELMDVMNELNAELVA